MKKRFLYRHILPQFGFIVVKIISATYRIRIINPEMEQNILSREEVPIYASWHQRFFPGITLFSRRRPVSIIISQSRDGDFISRIAEKLGFHPVRGSSSRGGRRALVEITRLARKGYKIVHIVDGPRGPSGVVKFGLLKIAQFSGMPILPSITSPENKWVFNSWDKFMIPKPFSRIIISVGDEVYIPRHLKGSELEEKRSYIERTLEQLYKETDLLWTDSEKIRQIFSKKCNVA